MLLPSMISTGEFIRRSSHFGFVDAGVEVTASLITCSVIRSTDAAIADTDVSNTKKDDILISNTST
jgi:hypothetical protein